MSDHEMIDSSEGNALAGAAESADAPVYWRSFDQLDATPAYESFLHREFQDGADEPPADPVSRRNFLSLMAASMALAGMTSCRKPVTRILPFQKRPEDLIPGVPRFYATAFTARGYGVGTLVKSNDGRPTKVEGNPKHPSSRGGTNSWMQGDLLNLYDPARSKQPRKGRANGGPATGAEFAEFRRTHFQRLAADGGTGLAFLMEPTTSPSQLAIVEAARARFPKATFHVWSPLHRDEVVAGSRLAFGGTTAVETQCNFARADVVLSLDCDFLAGEPDDVRHARDYASRRKVTDTNATPSRLYVAEAGFSLTGAAADHRFRMRAADIATAAFALAAELGVLVEPTLAAALAAHRDHGLTWRGKNWVAIVAKDLLANRGKSLVCAGSRQPAVVHAIVHAINAALDNVGAGKPIEYTLTPPSLAVAMTASIQSLAESIGSGATKTLVILGGNPVYDAPADLKFADLLARPGLTSIHLGLHCDETGTLCDWHVHRAHELEAWGDIRAFDGTLTIQQPLIAPLYDGSMTVSEALAAFIDPTNEQPTLQKKSHDIVREHHRTSANATDFEGWWTKALHDGLVDGSKFATGSSLAIQHGDLARAIQAHPKPAAGSAQSLEVVFQADARMLDGRFSNNAWMMELPDPITKLVWDNGALMSRATADALGVGNGDVVKLSASGREVEAPVWILPGCADFVVVVTFGFGRRLGADHKIAAGAGYDAFALRTAAAQSFVVGATATKTGRSHQMVSTQDHGSMEGRALVREASLEHFKSNPGFAPAMTPLPNEDKRLKSLWVERDYSQGYQWGMVIDLNSCIGCNACVVACTSENNIPIVGKADCAMGREMHWLRIDRYFSGKATQDGVPLDADPAMVTQPVPCMQCENAPCESVCPVAATMHSPEGLNDMVYNRCIGTRYCSNNCPYKVRRFNWFNYTGKFSATEEMAQNPDVTVRSRGVMEKCTYCVQRIQSAKIRARNANRLVRDGDVTTACAEGCPTQAITFGNIVDPESQVAKAKQNPLNYAMVSQTNVKPRTTYLAKIRNPNPELAAQ
jgi:MoCo/4Fe-4S cofactor protein with predicted Tat translocation signal